MTTKKYQSMHVKIPIEDNEKLNILKFASLGLTKTDIIRLALKNYIKQHEGIINEYTPLYKEKKNKGEIK